MTEEQWLDWREQWLGCDCLLLGGRASERCLSHEVLGLQGDTGEQWYDDQLHGSDT